MPLTDKEKRIITSPLSFSSKQRKNTKFRTRKKIQAILCDMNFLIQNNSNISEMFGIDILGDDTVIRHVSEQKIEKIPKDDIVSDDSDLL